MRTFLRTVLLALVLAASYPVASQSVSFRLRGGYAGYRMKSMKTLLQGYVDQSDIFGQSPFSVPLSQKITDNFPSYYAYQFQVVHHPEDDQTGFGFLWDHVSTGARVAYQDYSGEMLSDLLLSADAVGLLYEEGLRLTDHWSFLFSFQAQVTFTTLLIEDYVRIYEESETFKQELYSVGIGVTPGISAQYQLFPFSLGVDAGFHSSMARPFRLVGSGNTNPLLFNGEEIEPGWNGFRVGVRVGWTLGDESSGAMYDDVTGGEFIRQSPGFSPDYYADGRYFLKFNHLRSLLWQTGDQQIRRYYNSQSNLRLGSIIVGSVGGFLTGWSVGALVAGDSFDSALFTSGLSSLAVSVLINQLARRKANKAIARYNALLY